MSSEPQRQAELFVRFREVGFHCWPAAPDHRAYLRVAHRHVFHVEVRMATAADDSREVEYHDLLDVAASCWAAMAPLGDLGERSCESMAAELADELAGWAGRRCSVSISEDGEAGALVSSAVQELGSERRSGWPLAHPQGTA